MPPGRLLGIVHEFIKESNAVLGRRARRDKCCRDDDPAARVGVQCVSSQDIHQYFKLEFQLVLPDGDGQPVPDGCGQPAPVPIVGGWTCCQIVSEAAGADRRPIVTERQVPESLSCENDPARLAIGRGSTSEVVNRRAGKRPITYEGLRRVRADPGRLERLVLRHYGDRQPQTRIAELAGQVAEQLQRLGRLVPASVGADGQPALNGLNVVLVPRFA
jgi:hypothetical protein